MLQYLLITISFMIAYIGFGIINFYQSNHI